MEISRRSFLKLSTAALAAAAVLDPELLLWRPGARTIFVPAPARVLAAESFSRGDVVEVAGRYMINPHTWKPVTYDGEKVAQQFVVLEDVRAGEEILARGVCPSIELHSRSDDWEAAGRQDHFNGEPLSPGDHVARGVLVGRTVSRTVSPPGFSFEARPASSARGFVLEPPDRRTKLGVE